jgi:undecaprenyl-diphosphatase
MNSRIADFLNHLIIKDIVISEQISNDETPGLPLTLAILVTRSGDGLPSLVAFAALLIFGSEAWRERALILLLGDILTLVVVQVLKITIRRPRPEGEWGEITRKIDPLSFPSGHSARGGVMTGLALALGPPWFRIAAPIWGVMVALSRVVVGVHYLSDVVVGFLVGLSIAGIIALVVL